MFLDVSSVNFSKGIEIRGEGLQSLINNDIKQAKVLLGVSGVKGFLSRKWAIITRNEEKKAFHALQKQARSNLKNELNNLHKDIEGWRGNLKELIDNINSIKTFINNLNDIDGDSKHFEMHLEHEKKVLNEFKKKWEKMKIDIQQISKKVKNTHFDEKEMKKFTKQIQEVDRIFYNYSIGK